LHFSAFYRNEPRATILSPGCNCLDNADVSMIVEMVRGETAQSAEHFDLSWWSWNDLLQIAKQFGWKPMGTIPYERFATADAEYRRSFKNDYDPDEWRYCKCVSDTDAASLGAALRRAAVAIREGRFTAPRRSGPTIIGDSMSAADIERADQPAVGRLGEFALYCGRGGFRFAFDD
jgi:hypothetical protein